MYHLLTFGMRIVGVDHGKKRNNAEDGYYNRNNQPFKHILHYITVK